MSLPDTTATAPIANEAIVDDDAVTARTGNDQSLPATAEESGWAATYAGKLDGKLDASLDLYGLGDVVRGTITYKKSGKPIMVLGSFRTDGTFFLREYQPDGNVTGVISGTEKSKKLIGSWYAPGTDKELKLDFDVVTVQEEGTVTWPYSAKGISGEYGYHFGKEGPSGVLIAKQVGDKVRFSIDCVTGAPGHNMAMVDAAEAPLIETGLHYKVPELDCEFQIQFFDGFAVVTFVDEKYDCEFGHNASIEGEFVKLK